MGAVGLNPAERFPLRGTGQRRFGQTYFRLNSGMYHIPTGYGATAHEGPPEYANAASPSVVPTPEQAVQVSSSVVVIRALDEVLSELRALEIKYMLEPDLSGGPAIKVPFLLRLKFRCKGNRDLKAILGELRRHNEDLKAMTKDLRKTIRCNLAMSAHRMNSMGVEIHPATGHITPPQADEGFSTLSTEDLIVLSPTISLDVGDATAVDDPPRIPPRLTSALASSAASSRVDMSAGVFESSTTFISYEREDNYSVNKLKGDKICTQCHQVCRGVGYS